MSVCLFVVVMVIGGSNWALGTRAPSRSKFFHFHWVSAPTIVLAPPGNPGSATDGYRNSRSYQIMPRSGGSRISQRTAQTPEGMRQSIIWQFFFLKTARKSKKLDPEGGRSSLTPPWNVDNNLPWTREMSHYAIKFNSTQKNCFDAEFRWEFTRRAPLNMNELSAMFMYHLRGKANPAEKP